MSFTQELLRFIQEAGELMPGVFEGKYEYAKRLRRSTYYGTVYRLEKRGLIKKIKKDNQPVFVLTDKGRGVANIRPIRKIKRNDGYSTLVIFDIPKEKNRERTKFRRFLIRNSYTLLQESVLISPYRFSSELEVFAEDLGIRKYLTLLTAKVDYSKKYT